MIDAIKLTQELIRRPSVTPADAGAMDIVEQTLKGLGFACRRMRFGQIENLYARYGTESPNLCFAGHTDVVPVGDAAAWTQGAFDGEVVLVTDEGEQVLRAGDCAGFPAGAPNGHHLQNRSDAEAVVLEVGSRREAEDGCDYPDIDMIARPGEEIYRHRDGTPYADR